MNENRDGACEPIRWADRCVSFERSFVTMTLVNYCLRGIGRMAASVNDICNQLVMILTPYFIVYMQTLARIGAFLNHIAGF